MEETLKEVAEKYVDSFEYSIAHPRRVAIKSFINGAKWQQERMYNEMNDYANYRLLIKKPLPPKEWFEKFKKK